MTEADISRGASVRQSAVRFGLLNYESESDQYGEIERVESTTPLYQREHYVLSDFWLGR